MQQPSPEDIEELLDELEKEYGTEEALPPEVENLLQDLQPHNRVASRRRAAEQLGKLSESNLRIVQSLVAAGESTNVVLVQRAILEALRAPAHQVVLQEYPELTKRAASTTRQVVAAERRWRRTKAVVLGLVGAVAGAGLFWLIVWVARFVMVLVAAVLSEGQWDEVWFVSEPVVIWVAAFVGAAVGAIAGVTTVLVERDWQWMHMGFWEAISSDRSRRGEESAGCAATVIVTAMAVVFAFAEVYWVLGQLAIGRVAQAIQKQR